MLSSPSGAGKTTLARLLLEQEDDIRMSISATTRPMRPGEEDGKDYYFLNQEQFSQMVANDEFLECAEVFGNQYGTPQKPVEEALNSGIDVLFDIDWQGAQQLAKQNKDDLVSIFILPPNMQVLEERLKGRAQDSADVIADRMSKAKGEISHWRSYGYVVINEDLDESLATIRAILRAERHKRSRRPGLDGFVGEMLES